MSLTECRQNRLEGPVHPLSYAVALRVIRSFVTGGDGVTCAEVSEVLAGELTSVVHHNVARKAVVCHILPHVFYDCVCVFCFKGKEPNKPTLMIYNSKHISISLYTICQVCQVYSHSL